MTLRLFFIAFTCLLPLQVIAQTKLAAVSPTLVPVPFSELTSDSLFDADIWSERIQVIAGVDNNLRFLDSDWGAHTYSQLFPRGFSRDLVRASLLRFRELLKTSESSEAFHQALQNEFQLYRSIGSDGIGTVKFTGYFQPVFKASPIQSAQYRYPIYKLPDDFAQWPTPHPKRIALEGYRGTGTEKSPIRGKEIAWLKNRYDAFMIHVQGSAILEYEDGNRTAVGYAGGTSYPFRGIPKKFLEERGVAWGNLPAHFRKFPEDLNSLLVANNRFIFFKELKSPEPIGSIGAPVIPGRSIATDKYCLPPGALGVIQTRIPRRDSSGKIKLEPSSRFVLDQDTGSAIKTPGRVDLFMGTGDGAREKANMIYSRGELFYVFLKEIHEVA